MTFPGLLNCLPPKIPLIPPGVWWVKFLLAENESHIYPYKPTKFCRGPTVVSKGGGVQTDIQTDRYTDTQRGAAALYSRRLCFRLYNALLDVMLREHFRGKLEAP